MDSGWWVDGWIGRMNGWMGRWVDGSIGGRVYG